MSALEARRYVSPVQGETLESLAARELPELGIDKAVVSLRTWNPHLIAGLDFGNSTLIVSQIVYLEPPLE